MKVDLINDDNIGIRFSDVLITIDVCDAVNLKNQLSELLKEKFTVSQQLKSAIVELSRKFLSENEWIVGTPYLPNFVEWVQKQADV